MKVIPRSTYERIKNKLWQIADTRGWLSLSDQQKSNLYEEWLRDANVGGVLSRYLDPGNVRVYIKDTVMKPYGRERIKDFNAICQILALQDANVQDIYIKPHGRKLHDGKVICWGQARDWKAILFAVFERAHLKCGTPFAAIILFPNGKYLQPKYRSMIEMASEKLGIERLVWQDF